MSDTMFVNTIVTSLPAAQKVRVYINGKTVFSGVVAALPSWIKRHCARMSPAEREQFNNKRVDSFFNPVEFTHLYIQR